MALTTALWEISHNVSLAECQAKCIELDCHCMDYAVQETTHKPRAGEKCRICKARQTYLPLHASGAGYSSYL